MRDILFRAKWAKDGEWMYGSYVDSVNVPKGGANPFPARIVSNGWLHCIDESTVGQFTGLLDKYKTKIFEGDIVRYNGWRDPLTVRYEKTTCQFRGISADKTSYPLRVVDTIEVIGNIYDNPELLGGDDNGALRNSEQDNAQR